MTFSPGDLVCVVTPRGHRSLENDNDRNRRFAPDIPVSRGVRAIVLEVKPNGWSEVLVGGQGVWFVETHLLSKIRLEFRKSELERLKTSENT